MRRGLALSFLMLALVAGSLTGCGGGGSSITGPTLLEVPAADE
jgi:predicted small lipoprotein YifL